MCSGQDLSHIRSLKVIGAKTSMLQLLEFAWVDIYIPRHAMDTPPDEKSQVSLYGITNSYTPGVFKVFQAKDPQTDGEMEQDPSIIYIV